MRLLNILLFLEKKKIKIENKLVTRCELIIE